MKVLWFTNVALPEACQLMGVKPQPFGGWFSSVSSRLAAEDKMSLSIAFPQKRIKGLRWASGNNIQYVAFPYCRERRACRTLGRVYDPAVRGILTEVKPELVVVFGTEGPHALSVVLECKRLLVPCAVSIQGLLFTIAEHYMSGIPAFVQHRASLLEIVRYPGNIAHVQQAYQRRSVLERRAIEEAEHIIGRTTWDRACVSQINPSAVYYHCNETLRDSYYRAGKWSVGECEKHAIVVSQWGYPIKGLHFALQAMPVILRRFPDTKLYVCGGHCAEMHHSVLYSVIFGSSYRLYIKALICRLGLEKSVVFTGVLAEEDMCKRMRSAHVFVSASSVENESNSLSEAKLLGVPCVASYVGGVVDRITHGVDGFFYQHDAAYMLAHYVGVIFDSDDLASQISHHAIQSASDVNDPSANLSALMQIYERVACSGKDNRVCLVGQ